MLIEIVLFCKSFTGKALDNSFVLILLKIIAEYTCVKKMNQMLDLLKSVSMAPSALKDSLEL